jgi:hypothetical protein
MLDGGEGEVKGKRAKQKRRERYTQKKKVCQKKRGNNVNNERQLMSQGG